MDAHHLALHKRLAQQFRLKFDGSRLSATCLRTGVRVEVAVTCAEVLAAEGCTKSALLHALARQAGLLASPPAERVPWAERLVDNLGLDAGPVYASQCHVARVPYLLPGMATAVEYVVVRLLDRLLLVVTEVFSARWVWLALNHFLTTVPYVGTNPAIKAYQETLQSLSKDAQLPYQLEGDTATQLGIPSISGVWLIS